MIKMCVNFFGKKIYYIIYIIKSENCKFPFLKFVPDEFEWNLYLSNINYTSLKFFSNYVLKEYYYKFIIWQYKLFFKLNKYNSKYVSVKDYILVKLNQKKLKYISEKFIDF